MRMEELSENRYIKGTDTVEKYLLDLVRDFFKQEDFQPPETSREHIIEKAVERMKEELSFEEMGVISIKLPNGDERTGMVSITLEDLGGEPAIVPKLSAFNVSFGDKQNTACEGNDPRLSDKREPLEHEHSMEDIIGLAGIVSTLQGKLDRLLELSHKHENKNALDILDYTGTNNVIDLTVIDTYENDFKQEINRIESKLISSKADFEGEVSTINAKMTNVLQEVANLNQHLVSTNQSYLQQAKDHTDNKITELDTQIQTQLEGLIRRDLLTPIIETANNTPTLVGTVDFLFEDIIQNIPGVKYYTGTVDMNAHIIQELANRGKTLKNCQTEAFIEYTNPETGKKIKSSLPYLLYHSNSVDGSLQIGTLFDDGKIFISLNTNIGQIPAEVLQSRIIYNVYSTQPISL